MQARPIASLSISGMMTLPSPTAAPHAAQEPLLRPKQSTPLSGSRSARQTRAAGLRVATNRVLVELARIAFADIGDVFDEHGAVIPFADLPPGIRSAIAEYRVRHGRNGTYTVCVRLHSKLAALTALGRHLGIFDCRSDRAILARCSSRTQPKVMCDERPAATKQRRFEAHSPGSPPSEEHFGAETGVFTTPRPCSVHHRPAVRLDKKRPRNWICSRNGAVTGAHGAIDFGESAS